MRKFLIVIEKAGNNYSAYSPDVLGCISTGKTPEETRRNMREAIEFHLEGLVEDGDPIPESESTAEYILVNEPQSAESESVAVRS